MIGSRGRAGHLRFWPIFFTLALSILLAACSAGQTSLDASLAERHTDAQIPPALFNSRLGGLPPVPKDSERGSDRRSSFVQSTTLNGIQSSDRSSGPTEQGNSLRVASQAGVCQWAMYEFTPPTTQVISVIFDSSAFAGSSDWIAIANYDTMRWEIKGPYPLTPGGMAFPNLTTGNYVSPNGHTYVAALSWGAGVLTVNSVTLSAENGLTSSYSVSGVVTKSTGGGLPGVTMTLSPGGATTQTDAGGNFTFGSLAPGSYNVTPSLSNYSFEPPLQTAVVDSSDITGVDFVGTDNTVQTYSISGTVNKNVGGALAGTTLTLTPGGVQTTSAGDGTYTFTGVTSGNYTVTPTLTDYTFQPASQNVPVTNANVNFVSFTGTQNAQGPPWTVSGFVKDANNNPIAGVIVFIPFKDIQTTTDSQGFYQFTGLNNDNDFHLLCSKDQYSFDPPVIYATLNANMTQDFVGLHESLPATVSFENHMKKQVLEAMCTVCHSSTLTGSKRHGAPLGLDFDTYNGTSTNQKSKSNQDAQNGSMPDPAFGSLGLTTYQKQLFQKWKDQNYPL